MARMSRGFWTLFLVLSMTACGGGGGSKPSAVTPPPSTNPPSTPPPASQSYVVGGTAVGVGGEAIILEINQQEPLTLTEDGDFIFPTPVVEGQTYTVRLANSYQYSDGQERCSILGASGTASASSETAISLRCVPQLGLNSTFSANGLEIVWSDIGANQYDLYVMPKGETDISNYSVFPGAEMIPDVASPLAALEAVSLGEWTFVVEAQFIDGHAFESGPATDLNGTPLGGILQESTSLNKTESPYRLFSQVQVPQSMTLEILDGVRVDRGRIDGVQSETIFVFGSMTIEGLPDSPVTLDQILVYPQRDSETWISEAELDVAHAIVCGGTLSWGGTHQSPWRSLTITDSEFFATDPIFYSRANTAGLPRSLYIARNVFVESGEIHFGSLDNVDGSNPPGSFTVENNAFLRSASASVASYGSVSNGATPAEVRWNSFLSTDRTAVYLQVFLDGQLDARENFWNSTDEAVIQSMIFDANDDLRVANEVPFRPFLDAPHPDTPAIVRETCPIRE